MQPATSNIPLQRFPRPQSRPIPQNFQLFIDHFHRPKKRPKPSQKRPPNFAFSSENTSNPSNDPPGNDISRFFSHPVQTQTLRFLELDLKKRRFSDQSIVDHQKLDFPGEKRHWSFRKSSVLAVPDHRWWWTIKKIRFFSDFH